MSAPQKPSNRQIGFGSSGCLGWGGVWWHEAPLSLARGPQAPLRCDPPAAGLVRSEARTVGTHARAMGPISYSALHGEKYGTSPTAVASSTK